MIEWDPGKARANLEKHGIDFADAATILDDRTMKREYDFSSGKRGPVVKPAPGKTRIAIRIDDDVLEWFREQAHAAGGGSYQTMMNAALREFISSEYEPVEETVRRVVREELAEYGSRFAPPE